MDRISCLPDEVICHILSFLETSSSVQTSVLSKRWRFPWADVPFLEFDVLDTRRVNVITRIVLQHKHDIHTFRLLYVKRLDDFIEEEFQSWIVNITTRNIRNLHINLEDYQFELPQCLFTCKTIFDLSLGCCDIPMRGIYLPALKKLHLYYVLFESEETLAHLISSCLVLEELTVVGGVLGHCFVSSPTITNLELRLDQPENLRLDTPALRYLQLDCFMTCIFSAGALDSLIEADIILYWHEEHQDNLVYSSNVLAFVCKLHNVKLLSLITHQLTVIRDSAFTALANKFNNLTTLDLCTNLGFISFFLENANNLQVLKVKILNTVDIDNQYNWMEPKQVSACLMSNLQTVKLCRFVCSEEEIDMVRYILKNAKVLKMMEIKTKLHKHDWEKKFNVIKRLALFKRGSEECEFVFD